MHLHLKPSSKIVEPRSVVDEVLEAQGFMKKMKKDRSYYNLRLRDSITGISYDLQIPYKEVLNNNQSLYRISEIQILTKSPIKNQRIPPEIIDAAKEKVNEVFSYLFSNSHRKVML